MQVTNLHSHRWIPERKEWVPEAPKNDEEKGDAGTHVTRSHIPRSLQPDTAPRSGLLNLLRVF